MNRRILHDNPWLQLVELRAPDRGINGYVISHESRCNGQIVAVLPSRSVPVPRYMYPDQYLLRHEVCPPWGIDPVACAITGGMDHVGESPLDVAVRELYEEAGYRVDPKMFTSLGTCRGTKSTDTVFHLFHVDLTGKEPEEAPGDGSRLEAEAWCEWHERDISQSPDPLVSIMWLRRLRLRLWRADDR